MQFFSLIGTQVMAVLNPLLSYLHQKNKINNVVLFATDESLKSADIIKNFLIEGKLFETRQIDIHHISSSLDTEGETKLSAPQAFVKAINTDDELLINLAGGMNFQIAAVLEKLKSKSFQMLYPEKAGIQFIRIEKGVFSSHALYPFAPAQDVLTLQNIEWEQADSKDHPALREIFKDSVIKEPPSTKKHIRIGGVTFDRVWNFQSGLKFLKLIIEPPQKLATPRTKASASKQLKRIRDVIAVATNRNLMNDLYHRDIVVITDDDFAVERLRTESLGKIKVIQYSRHSDKPLAWWLMKEGFISYYKPTQADKIPDMPKLPVFPVEAATQKTLVTVLGEDIIPTLIAIWSHRPKRLILLFTPTNEVICTYREALLADKLIPFVEDIIFIPMDIGGFQIFNLPAIPGKVEVNITPGTKAHTAYLTFWANINNARIFSIDTKSTNLKQLPHGTGKKLATPSIPDILRCKGVPLKKPGDDMGKLKQKKFIFQSFQRLLKAMAENDHPIADFPRTAINLGNAQLIPDSKNRSRIVFGMSARPVFISHNDGEWFEQLVGYMLVECGADDVRTRVQTQWSKEKVKRLKGKNCKHGVHKTDIDVVARFQSKFIVISCKATKKEKLKIYAHEVVPVSTYFGRFSIPLLCFLKYDGEPFKHSDTNVTIFGYKTLIDRQKLWELLEKAMTEKQRTRTKVLVN